jgi:protein-disulfide isomerase
VDRLIDLYGKDIRVTFRHFPLAIHPGAEDIARAAVCADRQGAFWEFHDQVFNQSDPGPIALLRIVDKLKLDAKSFVECAVSLDSLMIVRNDKNVGIRNGVSGTPTFFINGRMQIGASFEEMCRIIDGERMLTKDMGGSAVKERD